MNSPRVTVVIVTYESGAHIDECLAALERVPTPAMQIVVVDNGSTDETVRRARSHPGVEVVSRRENLGFAGAANLGACRARGRKLLFLNPDTVMAPGCLSAMEERLGKPGVGVVGCKIYSADGGALQHVGGIVRQNGLTEHIGRGEPDRGQFDRVEAVPYVSGAAMLLAVETWRALDGFDERFWPLYYEDVDLCAGARDLGLRVEVESRATLRHHEGGSAWQKEHETVDGVPSPGLRFYDAYHTNRLRFVRKRLGPWSLLTSFLPAELSWLGRGGARGHAVSLIRSYWNAVSGSTYGEPKDGRARR